jgi:hypothetical protein
MNLRLAAVVACAVTLAACSPTHKTVHLTAGGGHPDPYDVQAARLCKALEVYIKDARANNPSPSDSHALENAEKKLKAGHPEATAKWAPLAANVDGLLLYANQGDANDIPPVGLKIGLQCQTIPPLAKKAGGYA